MKKHIGYTLRADLDIFSPSKFFFQGLITYFDGEEIIVTESPRFESKEEAWKWIAEKLKEWEEEK